MKKKLLLFLYIFVSIQAYSQNPVPECPRIVISTDCGGTDPDDNQSIAHLLMYSNEFDIEGIISSPSYGSGSKEEIIRMIDIYEKDLPKLKKHLKKQKKNKGKLASPKYLKSVTKQGRKGGAPLCGYQTSTEGSEWIVKCARKNDQRKLYVLVWGGLDDVAQALHDAPDIKDKIRVYWIGGPNKKWSVNTYVYLVENFPDLWFIENNASYRGFIYDSKVKDSLNAGYYDAYIKGAGHLGADFINYYKGNPKLGDTPSLLYMMDGDPADPGKESWGGSFELCTHSPRKVFYGTTSEKDTIQAYGIMELHMQGPVRNDIKPGTPCLTLDILRQKWEGYYMGNGDYMVRYSTYTYGTHPYTVTSTVDGFTTVSGSITVDKLWPGSRSATDYTVGKNWYTDRKSPELFRQDLQGAQTVYKWRADVMKDWAERWAWLK